jgi:pimeloyl-ACP methyl ester carboxylesterase
MNTWIEALIDPFSRAVAPLADGFLRQALLRMGVAEQQVRLHAISIHYYHRRAVQAEPIRKRRAILSMLARWILGQRDDRHPTPIVLIHGLGDNALTWALMILFLAPGRDIYAVDLPGYGLSGLPVGQPCASMAVMEAILAVFLEQVVGCPVLVVGNSLGGWLAVRLACSAAAMVRAAVLINPGGAVLNGFDSWAPFRATVAVPDLATTRQAIRQVVGWLPAALIYIGQRSIQERFQRQVVRAFVETATEHDFLTAADLQRVPIPTALVWGLKDTFLPDGSLAFFTEHLPHATTLLIQHCGHLPQREHPLTVARFVDRQAELQDSH